MILLYISTCCCADLARGAAAAEVRPHQSLDVESAVCRVRDDAILGPVVLVAVLDRLSDQRVQGACWDEAAPGVLHDERPHLGWDELGPVDRRRYGEDAIEIIRELLCFHIPLASAGGTSVPIREGRCLAVEGRRQVLPDKRHLVDREAGEILEQLLVEVDARAVEAHRPKSRVRRRRRVSGCYLRSQRRGEGTRDEPPPPVP